MTYDSIFAAYYTMYRAEAQTPSTADDEYVIAMALANEAINRWANYDNTLWRELFSTLQTAATGTKTIVTGTTSYAAPTDMREAGGFIRIKDSSGNTLRAYPILEPHEAQFKTDASHYAYFTGNPNLGFTLHINPAPDTAINGMSIDYDYYMIPSLFTTGSDKAQMSQPYFIVHRILANRFRASRNPYYGTAKDDAEDVLKTMQLENNSGNWASPWSVADNSGAQFGMSSPTTRMW